jgi:integration host factor subunit alpha
LDLPNVVFLLEFLKSLTESEIVVTDIPYPWENPLMTKADLVEKVYLDVGLSKGECAEIVELALEIMKEALEHGETVKISGFGNFVVRQKRARRGRNPQSGEDIEITPRKVLTFKPSILLKKAINLGV